MGIVQRQGLRNTVISYVGLGIGFVNTTLILPRLLLPAQLGLTTVLVALATLTSQFSALGFTNTTLRFFPYFRNRAAGHQGFVALLLGLPLALFGGVATLMWAGRPLVLQFYVRNPADAALVTPNYGVMLALALAILLYNLLDAYAKSLFRSSFSSFLNEIVLRLLIVGAALAFGAGYLAFGGFVLAYLGAYAAVALLLLLYLALVGELPLRPRRAVLAVRPLGELLRFGAFALLSNVSGVILVTIDALMLSAQRSLAEAGIYAIALNISTALAVPFRALYKTAYPLIAEYWKQGDTARLLDFYRRSTRLNTAVGAYLALGIALNLDFIYALIHRPEYAAGTAAVLLLLLGRLVDGVTGVNGIILVTSPRYRLDLLFNLGLSGSIVGLNYLLIPRLGLLGAGLSNCLALSGINLWRTWFVYRAFGWQPFDGRVFAVLGLAAAAGAVAWWLPAPAHLWLRLLWRGGLFTALYGGGVLLSGWVPEVTELVLGFLKGKSQGRKVSR